MALWVIMTPLGGPVVPLVYMMVQRSSGLGGYGSGVGALRPFSNMSPHGVTDTPSDSIAWICLGSAEPQ
eukprot:CAMPEP_0202416734 /NCGR_PEP_ID=MMETSP1128-20130828/40522_1 /ASSEMBLY_ACC=CAM_ASM_000463 /TAXON_ID=3047 /ORGANISM="Dunaliella tertiolecta, Strain CCMP1320" /LENGTH=68 /DNA_ID=CAMNT_0049023821 /DNA_START=178 /DNA_END=384 /DNA_ORIENTATION=+